MVGTMTSLLIGYRIPTEDFSEYFVTEDVHFRGEGWDNVDEEYDGDLTDNEDNLKEIRTQLSNQTIENSNGNKKKIVVWSHNMQEIEEGLKKVESHFKSITDNLYSIHDPKKLLTKIEVLKNE